MKKKDKEAGDKSRAGVLLSSFIRIIAQEKILVEEEELGKDPKKITKAEALARQIWNRALGAYKTVDIKTGVIKHHAPDKDMITLIFDRMEGKAGSAEDTKQKSESVPARIGRQNKERLNKIANETGDTKKNM